jgi:hypothetical protein
MSVLTELLQTLVKMFAADLWLSLTAVAVVTLCGVGLSLGLLPPAALPFLLATGVMAALVIGVARGARPKR